MRVKDLWGASPLYIKNDLEIQANCSVISMIWLAVPLLFNPYLFGRIAQTIDGPFAKKISIGTAQKRLFQYLRQHFMLLLRFWIYYPLVYTGAVAPVVAWHSSAQILSLSGVLSCP